MNLLSPEAMGVDVTATMRQIGVEIEWPPTRVVRKVAIVGARLVVAKEEA